MPKLPDNLLNVKDMDGVRRALKALSDQQARLEDNLIQFSNANQSGSGAVNNPIPPVRPGDALLPEVARPPRPRDPRNPV